METTRPKRKVLVGTMASHFQIIDRSDIVERGLYEVLRINDEGDAETIKCLCVTNRPKSNGVFTAIDMSLPYHERFRHWNDKYYLDILGICPYSNGTHSTFMLIRREDLEKSRFGKRPYFEKPLST